MGAGLAALVLAGGEAWRARQQAGQARARLAEVRREVEAASARLRALDARARGATRALPAAEATPARIVADVASVLPGDARLERLSIDYARGGALEMQVVARDATSWDRLLDRLERAPWLREVQPGPETREAEVRSSIRARWAGGEP
jgi:Tfp pilus assembly protein PilN